MITDLPSKLDPVIFSAIDFCQSLLLAQGLSILSTEQWGDLRVDYRRKSVSNRQVGSHMYVDWYALKSAASATQLDAVKKKTKAQVARLQKMK